MTSQASQGRLGPVALGCSTQATLGEASQELGLTWPIVASSSQARHGKARPARAEHVATTQARRGPACSGMATQRLSTQARRGLERVACRGVSFRHPSTQAWCGSVRLGMDSRFNAGMFRRRSEWLREASQRRRGNATLGAFRRVVVWQRRHGLAPHYTACLVWAAPLRAAHADAWPAPLG